MRLFCVNKIYGFLFPVSCTSEWRLCQNEHRQHMDGLWRMEHCHVLTVWVDIIVSFHSARRSLGRILTD